MTGQQCTELIAYLQKARELTHSDSTFKEDQAAIKDFIDLYGDDISWQNIETSCKLRRNTRNCRDRDRRALYRWKMYKEGVPLKLILREYTGQISRACEVTGCPERDGYGFCRHRYKYRASCTTLAELDDLDKYGLARLKEGKKEPGPEKVDWIFGMRCSHKDAASAMFSGKY